MALAQHALPAIDCLCAGVESGSRALRCPGHGIDPVWRQSAQLHEGRPAGRSDFDGAIPTLARQIDGRTASRSRAAAPLLPLSWRRPHQPLIALARPGFYAPDSGTPEIG